MYRTLLKLLVAFVPVVAALALVPTGHAAAGGFSQVWDRGAGGERYVALGDSFTSGPGIAPQRPEGCSRSERNFPTLFAQAVDKLLAGGLTAYTDASCGGAQTRDLWAPQSQQGGLANPRQLDALGEDTTLVTFGTLGGNDVGLVGLATSCFTSNCVPAPGTDPNAEKFAALSTALTKGIRDARVRAPGARILVIGYGTYLPPGGCVATFGGALTVAEFDYVQGQIDKMSNTLADVAEEQGVDFVDMREIPGSVDHTACAAPEKQWIRAVDTYGDGATLHPSACGMSAMAQHLTRRFQELRGEPQTPFDASCVSAGPAVAPPAPTAPAPTALAPAPGTSSERDRAVRRAELRAEARTLRLKTGCQHQVKPLLRVRGRTGHVSRVRFSIGGKQVAVVRKAPYRVVLMPDRMRHRGKVKAVVTLRDAELRATRQLKVARPRCLR